MTVGETEYRTSQHPARRDDIVVCELDGEAVLYDERSGAVHRFNETTLTVWEACDGSRRVSEISRALAQRYALGSRKARTEVEKVIRYLEAKGLLSEPQEPATQPASRLPSRREMLCGGTAKLIYTAPLISTFFASGACASGPSASGAFGAGGCKTLGYSCGNINDCCIENADGRCQNSKCCLKVTKGPCDSDGDCCTGLTCEAETCEN